MKSVAMIRLTQTGRRAFAASLDEAEKLVSEGKAFKHNRGLYEMLPEASETQREKVEQSAEPETPEYDTQSQASNEYDTKVMQPVKRRGRPPKIHSRAE